MPKDARPLSVDEAARISGVSAKTIRRALVDGRLAGAWKVGSRWKIPPDALTGLRSRPAPPEPVSRPSKATRRPTRPQAHGDAWEM